MVLFILNENANNKAVLLHNNVSWIIVKYENKLEKFGIAIPTIAFKYFYLTPCMSFSVYMAAISGEIWLFAFYGVGSVCFLIALWKVLTTCKSKPLRTQGIH